MKMLKLVPAFALMALAIGAFAGTPKIEPKKTADAPTEMKLESATVMWFHFNGDASDPTQVADPSKYQPEANPTCPNALPAYRCDIKILSNTAQTQPDLSQPIQETRKRSTPLN